MDLKELQERNYAATVRRGFITEKTSVGDFLNKIDEELDELGECLFDSVNGDFVNPKHCKYCKKDSQLELADIILVCLAMAKHYDIDIMKVLEEKVVINENRKD